jgi:hypothetical protein
MSTRSLRVDSSAEIERERERILRDGTLAPGVRRRKAKFLASLAELVREYEKPFEAGEWLKQRIRWEDWATLRAEGVAFAREAIGRRRWRGARDGVVPGGLTAEDITDWAITELLEGRGKLEIGFTRERILAELQRLVTVRVRRLHGLKEAGAMRSEWEVLPAKPGREPLSAFDELADTAGSRPGAAVEEVEEREERRNEIEACLQEDPKLRAVFGCVWQGIRGTREIAQRLGMPEREVRRVRKRLERRLAKITRQTRAGPKGSGPCTG